MTLKNNRALLLSNIKLCASFHHDMWIQTRVTVRKRLNGVMTSVTLTFDLWPWPFTWTSHLSMVIIPETDSSVLRAAWSQLKSIEYFSRESHSWRIYMAFGNCLMQKYDPVELSHGDARSCATNHHNNNEEEECMPFNLNHGNVWEANDSG